MSQISILIPSFNHAEFLPACVSSLTSQTFQDWSALAADDGSTDGSMQFLEGLKESRLTVIRNEANLGTYGTLNRALQETTGDFVAILNSDDTWAPNKLSRQVEALEAHPEASFCYTLGESIDAVGKLNSEQDIHSDWPKAEEQELLPYLLMENRLLASSILFRRTALRFRPELRYSGDWVALLDAALLGKAICVPETLTFWRKHDRNTSRRSSGQVSEEVLVRQSILAARETWKIRDIPESDLSKGLSTCAMHLSALLVLQGRIHEARIAARFAARKAPSRASLRRLVAVSLPASMAHRSLWHAEATLQPDNQPDLVEFGAS
jgi:hypothetical protein